MKIKLVQGDVSKVYRFQRTDEEGNVIKTLPKKMWLTLKNNCYEDEFVLQKTLEDNSITYSETDNYYRFQFKSEDTCNLPCGKYGFDIAIINENDEKKTLKKNGELELEQHYTHKSNEV